MAAFIIGIPSVEQTGVLSAKPSWAGRIGEAAALYRRRIALNASARC